MSSIGNRTKGLLNLLDQGAVLVPFGFKINGTSNPVKANNLGDFLQGVQVTRAAAGKFTFSIPTAVVLLCGFVNALPTADNVDLTGQVGGATDVTTGSVVVRTMTGAVATDPADGTIVSGFLLVKTTTKRASQ